MEPALHDALCGLYARVLVLDAEKRQISACLSLLRGKPRAITLKDLQRRERDLQRTLEELTAEIERLRASADPAGEYL